FLFFNPGNLLVLICAVFLYWCRLLDCFTSAEFIGLEILPIRQMAMGLLPALAVTCVAFCAFTHAFYLVNGGPKVESMVDIVFETFATLITAALPPDISTGTGNQVKLILCILAVSFFTVFILNIFIGVMGELYVKEKQRAEHTFRMYRAGSCYQYLLRSRVLQCNLMSADRGLLLMLVSGCVALTVQILGFINHEQRIPGTSIIFFVCQALILLGAYQSPDTPWVKGGRSGYQLWFCKEKSEKVQEPLVQDVSNTLEHMKGFLGEKHYAYNATLDFSMGSFSVNVRPDTGCEDEGVPKHPTAVGIGGQQTLRFFASKAESARKQAYDLHVQRLLGSETTLQSLAVEHGRLTPAFAPEVRSYKVSLDLESDMLKVWYRLRDNEQRLRVAAQKEEMARRLEGLERQEALHVVSGEVQYQDAYSSFMLDVGHKRSVTMTIQCADPTQASIGTYTLELQRGSCPPQRPYFEPDKRKCVNFCPEGFYRNDLDERCSRCNDNCKVCTGLLTCKMCVPDDVQYTYVIQPDGKCEAQANHIYARYKWWCAGFALLLLFLVCFGCAGICTLCHAPRKGAASKPERRRYFEDDLEEDKQLLQYPPGRRLGGY
ncbi:unnamed protein product, partial [Durusdinium trenchii]